MCLKKNAAGSSEAVVSLYNEHIPEDQNIRSQGSKLVSPLSKKSSTVE
jgi:hypothetical protein